MITTLAPRFLASIACASALLCAHHACGQDEPIPVTNGELNGTAVTQSGNEWRMSFGAAYTHRFEGDLDSGGGDVSVGSLTGGFNAATDLNRDLSLAFRLNFGVADYEFNGEAPTGIGALEPWNSIYSIAFGAVANYEIDDQWSVFGGPVFQFARESDADWMDSLTGGVIAGATYAFHDELVLGVGVGVVSQIEDSVRIFPFPIIEWQIHNNLSLSSRGASGGRTSIEFTGVELIWVNDEDTWELALGGGSSFSRFRLDDEGVAPEGVGQDESIPIWFRTSYRATPNIMIDAIAGIGFGGELTLDDEDGDSVAGSEYDAAFFIGLFGSIQF